MFLDPYRQMFLAGDALSRTLADPGWSADGEAAGLMARLEVPSGGRLLLAGLTDPAILPGLRLRLGLTGQLVILDPSPSRLRLIPGRDADWAVLLNSPATTIPNMDASLDVVLCWASFLELDHHYIKMTAEFSRVLAPGGRVLLVEPGPPESRPDAGGLAKLFMEAGFVRMAADEREGGWVFKAEKTPGPKGPEPGAGLA